VALCVGFVVTGLTARKTAAAQRNDKNTENDEENKSFPYQTDLVNIHGVS